MPASQPVRIIIKLPYNRPDNPPADPPKIEWTPEKADILWKVIEIQRTRAVDSAGADWIGLAAHLEVPLPYLLYRVNARFQEEIRGLKDIQGALSPTSPQLPFPITGEPKPPPSFTTKVIPNENRMSTSRQANGTPLGIRARLNSLSNNFAHRHKKVSTSSSTMTLQDTKRPLVLPHMRPTSPSSSSSDDTDSSDEEASKEEEAERIAEEEEALSRKLAELQNMMTNESIGLVSGTTRQKAAKTRDRGRTAPTSPLSKVAYLQDSHSHYSASASRSASQSVSSASSPRGSIHDIPGERNVNVAGQNLSMPRNPGSSPARAARHTQSHQTHRRHGPLVDRMGDLSSHGSEASSFSDLSDASLSASALDSDAFMSNVGTNNLWELPL